MIEQVLFVALPYLALFVCVVGSIYRIKTQSLSYTSLSSQFLENKALVWGSLPWHIGIILIILGHLLALLVPGFWNFLVSFPAVLYAIEALGVALAIGCVFGLIVLLIRRMTSAKIQSVTSAMDLVVLGLLLAQVVLGLGIAMHYKWGAAWATSTMTPYIYSLLKLQPDISYVQDMSVIIKAHIVGAWLLILLVPFSRLIHMFAAPIHYLVRVPQKVVWNNPRRLEAREEVMMQDETRRHFIKGAVGIAAGATLLSVGAMDKIFNFFFGPRLSKKEETEIMAMRLKKLEQTVDQRKLELERQESNYILIGALDQLSADSGKYFIDYEMRPGLAFKGEDGLPILLSAKCTHLGCTVGNQVNKEGKILCPCHVSFFDIKTGQPDAGAPAKAPLPFIAWVLMNKEGKIIARGSKEGKPSGDLTAQAVVGTNLYIVKNEAQA